MQVSSYHAATFAPIKAGKPQAHVQHASKTKSVSQPTQHSQSTKPAGIWQDKSFSFWDILDVINPLQHIPVISTIYRKIIGDEMGYASRIAGDTIYGGMLGGLVSSLVSAIANVFVDATTGKDIGEHMMASIVPSTTSTPASEKSMTPPLVLPMATAEPYQAPATQYVTVLTAPPAPSIGSDKNTLPAIDVSRVQAGVDQYKWQIMAGKVRQGSSRWA